MPQPRLNRTSLDHACAELARHDPVLARVIKRLGPPPLWKRPATFATFIRIILEQQVSLLSAKKTFERLESAIGDSVKPAPILRLKESGLRELGFTRQKARYCAALAHDVQDGDFKIGALPRLSDEEVRLKITERLGMGNWSADVYLMMALMRPDVLPNGDLALINGCGHLYERDMDNDSILELAESWRPYRSVATRIVWHDYLIRRRGTAKI